jgi:cullin-associated NEDD8-dissociated protein 1
MSSTVPLSTTVAALLKKTEHYDKDERYMATSDLCELLKKHSSSSSMTDNAAAGTAAAAASSHNSQPPALDAATERKICETILTLLHDKSHDVQAVAVKTLSVLLTTVQPEQVLKIADSLADQVLDAAKTELRDVYAMGLRTLVQTIPASMGQRVAQRLIERLMDFISNNSSTTSSNNSRATTATVITANTQEIVLACLDSLTDLLTRFGATAPAVTKQHEAILLLCLDQLQSSPPPPPATATSAIPTTGTLAAPPPSATSFAVVRKRAGHVLACLSTVLSDALLQRLIQALLRHLEDASSTAHDTRSVIRTMCAVSAAVGHRLDQSHIDRILPLFLRFTQPADALTGDDEDEDRMVTSTASSDAHHHDVDVMNELRESCFMGLESFVVRCPNEVESHLNQIITAALAFMSFDPNYSYGTTGGDGQDDEDAISEDDEDNEDNYEDEDDADDDDDDDDDESWKVRRSAIRVLTAVVESKCHTPVALWTVQYQIRSGPSLPVAQALVQRFKEREENCRVAVIECFTRLLAVSVAAASSGSGLRFATALDMNDDSDASVATINLQTEYAPGIVKACQTILSVKKGNDRSKSTALSLLATLSRAPGGVGGQTEIASVLAHVKTFLADEDTNALHREGTSKALRLDALSLVHALLASHETYDPVHMRKSLSQTLLPELCQAVNEQWYKVTAEALRALSEVPRVFVLGYGSDEDPAAVGKERTSVAKQLYSAIEPLLAAHDVDQEIKECALKACASLLSSLHSNMSSEQTGRLLSLLLDRLSNETTRMAAIKTLSSMAATDGGCDLQPILAESISGLASFLRLQNRGLKQSSLEALDIVVLNHGAAIDLANGELYTKVLEELAPLVTDRDLHLSHLSL